MVEVCEKCCEHLGIGKGFLWIDEGKKCSFCNAVIIDNERIDRELRETTNKFKILLLQKFLKRGF